MRHLVVPDIDECLLLGRGHAGIEGPGHLVVEGGFELLQYVGVVEHRRVPAAEGHGAIHAHRVVAAADGHDPEGHAGPLEECAAARDARELRARTPARARPTQDVGACAVTPDGSRVLPCEQRVDGDGGERPLRRGDHDELCVPGCVAGHEQSRYVGRLRLAGGHGPRLREMASEPGGEPAPLALGGGEE